MLKKFPVLSFLLLTLAISWSVVFLSAATIVAGRWERAGMIALVLVGQFGPVLAALIMTKNLHGNAGVAALLRSSVTARQPKALLGFALLFYPVLFAVAVVISVWRGAPAPGFPLDLTGKLAVSFIPTLVVGLVFGGLSEEPGWRGFLFPRLQRRIGFLGAGVAVGLFWAVWHLEPGHIATGWTDGWAAFWRLESHTLRAYLSETVPMSLIMAWLFNRSRGSVFLMIVIHASSNASVTALRLLWQEKPPVWSDTVTLVHWGTALVFVLLSIRGRRVHVDAGGDAGEEAGQIA